jgi:ribonuclease D
MSPPPTLVDTAAGLHALAAAAQAAPVLAVDTEFHAEGRRDPALMLVQVALPGGASFVVDPRAVPAAGLRAVLDGRPWVAFAGSNDRAVLEAALGVRPARLDDPQILAAFLGWHYPIGLADLAEELLGVRPDKSTALSDWSRRPLRPEQLAYAADDARLALALWEVLAAAAPPERVAWAREEAMAAPPPGAAGADAWWRGLGIAPRLDRDARQALRHLSAWRDQQSRARNRPLGSVATDAVLLDLARRRPRTAEEALQNRRLAHGVAQRDIDALVEVLLTAEQDPTAPPEALPAVARPRALLFEVAALAAGPHLGVAPGLLLPRSWNDAIARGHSLEGWRAALFADVIADIDRGTLAISMGQHGPLFVDGATREADTEKIFRRSAFPLLRVRGVP